MLCLNGNCRKRHVNGVKGSARGYCARCYQYQQRNGGQLPDPEKEKPESMGLHSFRAESNLKAMIAKVSDENFSTFVRRVVMQAVQQMPRSKP